MTLNLIRPQQFTTVLGALTDPRTRLCRTLISASIRLGGEADPRPATGYGKGNAG